MYHDFLNREIEDAEMGNMRDAQQHYCKECHCVVDYEPMGNGEEWGIRQCVFCDDVLCEKHAVIDRNGYTCCNDCFLAEGEQVE